MVVLPVPGVPVITMTGPLLDVAAMLRMSKGVRGGTSKNENWEKEMASQDDEGMKVRVSDRADLIGGV